MTVDFLSFWYGTLIYSNNSRPSLLSGHVKTLAAIERVVCKLWFSDLSLFLNTTTSLLISQSKGGEQSERTPPECSVKWPPMNENTWNFACKVLLWGTINFCSNGGHLASVEAEPIFFHFYNTLLSYRLHIWHARVFHEGRWASWVSETSVVFETQGAQLQMWSLYPWYFLSNWPASNLKLTI